MSFDNLSDKGVAEEPELGDRLFSCPVTKDATFLCFDNTAVPIHKSVAAQSSSVLKHIFYAGDKVPGSPEIYRPNSTVRLKANKEAASFVVRYLYFGLPNDADKWQHSTIAAQTGNSIEKMKKWVHHIREIATVAKRFNLRPILNFLICNIYKAIFYEKELVGSLLSELVSPVIEPEDTIEEFVILASYSFWFIKSTTQEDVVFSYGTHVEALFSYEDVQNLDERLFHKRPDIDHRTTPTVLLLGSNDRDMNGAYKSVKHPPCGSWNYQYSKENEDNMEYVFSEQWSGFPGHSGNNGCLFQLQHNKRAKRKAGSNSNAPFHTYYTVTGEWTKESCLPRWDALDGNVTPPVPFRFHMNND